MSLQLIRLSVAATATLKLAASVRALASAVSSSTAHERARGARGRALWFSRYFAVRAAVHFVAAAAAAVALLSHALPLPPPLPPTPPDTTSEPGLSEAATGLVLIALPRAAAEWVTRHWPRPSDSQTIAVLAVAAAADVLVPELPRMVMDVALMVR
jgi:hypothetical protein